MIICKSYQQILPFAMFSPLRTNSSNHTYARTRPDTVSVPTSEATAAAAAKPGVAITVLTCSICSCEVAILGLSKLFLLFAWYFMLFMLFVGMVFGVLWHNYKYKIKISVA
jgi:hypothetical protein